MTQVYGRLLLQGEAATQVFILDKESISIGSAAMNDIVLQRMKLDRAHARIECSEAGCTLIDLETESGTMVNNQKIQSVLLQNHDTVQLGNAILTFEMEPPAMDVTMLEMNLFEELQDAAEEAPPTQDSLVVVQKNGDKLPFFCVSAGYADVPDLTTLSNLLASDQPFYGLRPPQYTTVEGVEALAAHYVEQIQSVQTHGPYLLGGYSIGGIIAFEMAQQLQTMGEKVGLLVLLDTPYLALNPIPYANYVLAQNLYQLEQTLGNPLEKIKHIGWVERLTTGAAQLTTVLMERLGTSDMVIDPPITRAATEDVGLAINLKLTARYLPRPYPGPITLILAKWSSTRAVATASAWKLVAQGGLVEHVVPGGHTTLLKSPYILRLATTLRHSIDEFMGQSIAIQH